jgi:hypothetical protein
MIVEMSATPRGRSLDPVEPGKLYRVRSCNDPAVSTTCIDSTVVWAPLRPPVEDLPPAIVAEDGTIFGIFKDSSYVYQLSQLNDIVMRTMFENVDMMRMPAMTAPVRRWEAKGFQAFDNVLNNIYDHYEAMRLPQLEENPLPITEGYLVPSSIKDVAPEERNEYRAAHLYGRVEDDVIVFEPPSPKYTITVWADVSSEHCQQLMRDMDELNARGIRVRFLAFPLQGPYSADGGKMAEIWCSSDREAALKQALLGERFSSNPCEDTVLRQFALGKKLGFNRSPTVVTDGGEVIGGYLTPDQMLRRLQELDKPALTTK